MPDNQRIVDTLPEWAFNEIARALWVAYPVQLQIVKALLHDTGSVDTAIARLREIEAERKEKDGD